MLDVVAILELRISLETEAAGLAALRRTDTHMQQMRGILDDFANHLRKKTGNAVVADIAFHLLVASATGNRYFHDILKQLGKEIGRHTSELQSLMRISYAVFCLKKKKSQNTQKHTNNTCK